MGRAVTGRERACAVLGALQVRAPGDRTADDVAKAEALVGCFRGWTGRRAQLAAMLERAVDDGEAAKALGKLTEWPLLPLAWAWADVGDGPGCQVMTPGQRIVRRWAGQARAKAEAGLAAARSERDAEGVDYWTRRLERGALPSGVLVLAGGQGAGKTVPAVTLACRRGGRFVRAAALGELGFGADVDARLAELSRVRLLVIDELGREADKGPTPGRMTELLGTRADRSLPTIITTNLGQRRERATDTRPPALFFDERYGSHVLDRVLTGGGGWHQIAGDSLRRRGALPKLSQIRDACRRADLVERVEASTAADGRVVEADVDELARRYRLTEQDIERARARSEAVREHERARALAWLADLDDDDDGAAGFVERMVSGG